MREIMADSGADNVRHGLITTDAEAQTLNLQAYEGLYRHPDVASLAFGLPRLAPLHSEALLQSPIMAFYAPGPPYQFFLLIREHAPIIGGPMLHLPV